MTEKERFQRAFAPLHASPDTMTEVMKMTERKTKRPALRRAATLGLAAALVLALGSVAYASDLGGIQRTGILRVGDAAIQARDAAAAAGRVLPHQAQRCPLGQFFRDKPQDIDGIRDAAGDDQMTHERTSRHDALFVILRRTALQAHLFDRGGGMLKIVLTAKQKL